MKQQCAEGRTRHSWKEVKPEGIYHNGIFRQSYKRNRNNNPITQQMFECKHCEAIKWDTPAVCGRRVA